jgi:signal transduction histidine kinase/DNA-binding LacI/PurR family transcriptional regulator
VKSARPTIGLLAYSLSRDRPFWSGAADAARTRGANLICFSGSAARRPGAPYSGANAVYDLVDPENLDGLITWAGPHVGVTRDLDPGEVGRFLGSFSPLPMVNFEGEIGGIPCILNDTYQAMRDMTVHLIEEHKLRRIALITGPEDHPDTAARLRAYSDALKDHDVTHDPRLVGHAEGTDADRGARAMRALLDERNLRPGIDFDAVAAAESGLARGVLHMLRLRGIQVPHIAVTGFDDSLEDEAAIPPLTTVRMPYYEAGRRAAEVLLDLVEGRDAPQRVTVPAELVLRRSCGCLSSEPAVETRGSVRRKMKLSEIASLVHQAAGFPHPDPSPGWADTLLHALLSETRKEETGAFLGALDGIVSRVTAAGWEVLPLNKAISAMYRHILPRLDKPEEASRANELLQKARVIIGETAERAQMLRGLRTERLSAALRRISEDLAFTTEVEGLAVLLTGKLPGLGIPSCFLSVYEEDSDQSVAAAPEWSRLILAVTENGRVALEPGELRFRSRRLVPGGMFPQERCFTLVAQALFLRGNALGFMLLEAGPRDEWIYHALAGQVSGALHAVRLTEQVNHRALQLQTAAEVGRAVISLVGIDEVLSRTVELIRERFRYYRVAIYLIDENRMFALPQAVSGKTGGTLSEEAPVAVGEGSIVGRVCARGSPFISQDVAVDPLFIRDPALPDTRAAAIIPLRVGETIIGVLDVRSAHPDVFQENVVSTLALMADQFAVAVQNARLHAMEKSRARELGEAYRALKENQEKLLISEKMASLGRLTAGIAHEMNTPLAAVRTALTELDSLVSEYRDSLGDAEVSRGDHEEIAGEMQRAVRLAATAAERAAGFVHGIKSQTRDLSRTESRLFDMAPVIRETLLILSHALRQGNCEVSFQPDTAPKLYGSPGRLSQVVTNLVMNSIEASAPKGGKIQIDLTSGHKAIVLTVSDQGCGIPAEHLSRIYDPMFTTKPFGVGTGLGLALVHDIVAGELGGTIEVSSEVGRGTAFSLSFPPAHP